MKKVLCLLMVFMAVLCGSALAETEYEGSYDSNRETQTYYTDEMNRYILRADDLSKENLCYTIREIMEQCVLLDDDFIDCVSFWGRGNLAISVFIGSDPLNDLSEEEISQIAMSRLTRELLLYPELDKYWNKITFMTEAGSIILTKDMIRKDEQGRYFNMVFRYDAAYYRNWKVDAI